MQNEYRKLLVVALILLASFSDGVFRQLMTPGDAFPRSDIVLVVTATLLVFIWYRLDSDERSYRRTPFLNVAIVALAIVAIPYYLFKSRGRSRGSMAFGIFVACGIAYNLLQFAGEYVAYYVWQRQMK